MEVAASHAHIRGAIVDFVEDYRKMIAAKGSRSGRTVKSRCPARHRPRQKCWISWLSSIARRRDASCASAEIAKIYAAGESFRDRAAGFLAIPISRTPRDLLIFFRREILRSVNWAGDPNKSYASDRSGRA